ncbi:AMP-dependent synthetase/ligase [Halobacteriales archaeon Cl-PHB]
MTQGDTGGEPAWLRAEREYDVGIDPDGTIPQLFEDSAETHVDANAQRYKGGCFDRSLTDDIVQSARPGEYAALTYGEMRDVVRTLATGFRELGVEADDRVGILANTRMEWAQSDFALLAAGAVVTTVYTESSANQVRYLLDDPDATGVVVENAELLDRVHEVEDELDLSFKVLIDDPPTEYDRDDVYTLADVYDLGADAWDLETYRGWVDDRDPDDLASLIYTSGTTGQPKGVRLTHRNFRANVVQSLRRLGERPDKGPDVPAIGPDDDTISFLPLAHVFERLAGHFLMFGVGATVGYAESPDTVTDDIVKLAPTTGASVPRVYERIYDSMRDQAGESAVKERIFRWALGVARQYADADDPGAVLRAKHAVADRLVYSTVKEQLGGNLEYMVSGGGSLSADLCRTFIGMGVTIVEGYGLTETSPVVTINPPEDIRPGSLGYPLVGVETKLNESVVPQGEFEDTAGPVGELLVKGDNVTDGYWNKPRETEGAFTDDGWFRTGDIVEERHDGFLIFHERNKQIMVLSTGKNVAPGPIEDRFATVDRIDQIMVVGDGEKFVGAIIVPNYEAIRRWSERDNVDLPEDRDEWCQDERVEDFVGEAVDNVNEKLEKVEQIKQFELVGDEWTAEKDLLTPSMKKKRRNIKDVYAEELDSIYGRTDEADEQTADDD